MNKRRECRATGHTHTPIQAVWDLVADHAGMSRWAPVRTASIEREGTPAPNGTGAIRMLRTPTGTLREEITGFEAPHKLTYRLLSGAPVRDYHGEVELASRDGGTHITWTATFTPRLPGVPHHHRPNPRRDGQKVSRPKPNHRASGRTGRALLRERVRRHEPTQAPHLD